MGLRLALEELQLFPCSSHLSIVVEDDGVIEVNERVVPGGGGDEGDMAWSSKEQWCERLTCLV